MYSTLDTERKIRALQFASTELEWRRRLARFKKQNQEPYNDALDVITSTLIGLRQQQWLLRGK
jgi:hypothetical protein